MVKAKIRKVHSKHLLDVSVGVLPKEVCSALTHQDRVFCVLLHEGQLLIFTEAECISAEIIDHPEDRGWQGQGGMTLKGQCARLGVEETTRRRFRAKALATGA